MKQSPGRNTSWISSEVCQDKRATSTVPLVAQACIGMVFMETHGSCCVWLHALWLLLSFLPTLLRLRNFFVFKDSLSHCSLKGNIKSVFYQMCLVYVAILDERWQTFSSPGIKYCWGMILNSGEQRGHQSPASMSGSQRRSECLPPCTCPYTFIDASLFNWGWSSPTNTAHMLEAQVQEPDMCSLKSSITGDLVPSSGHWRNSMVVTANSRQNTPSERINTNN